MSAQAVEQVLDPAAFKADLHAVLTRHGLDGIDVGLGEFAPGLGLALITYQTAEPARHLTAVTS